MEAKIFGGRKIKIRELSKRDLRNVKKFQDFINSLVEEEAQILINKKFPLKKEREWLKGQIKRIEKHKHIFLVVEDNNKIVGMTEIYLGIGRQEHVGNLAISIRKGYRGMGLGVYLTKEIIKLAKRDLKPKPKIIRLDVFPTNKPAIGLYKKCGFKKVATIPKQIKYKGKLIDEIIMLLYL